MREPGGCAQVQFAAARVQQRRVRALLNQGMGKRTRAARKAGRTLGRYGGTDSFSVAGRVGSKLFQIRIGQLREEGRVDVVFGEGVGVLLKR